MRNAVVINIPFFIFYTNLHNIQSGCLTLGLNTVLSDRVKKALETAGLSQAELARKTGIAPPSLHDIESGKTKSLRSTTLVRMAKALGQTPDWLAGGIGKASSFEL